MAEKLERAKGFVRGAKINELIYSVYGPQIAVIEAATDKGVPLCMTLIVSRGLSLGLKACEKIRKRI